MWNGEKLIFGNKKLTINLNQGQTKLLKILNEQTDYSRKVFEKTVYSDEIAFEEFFIWWYHFIYTDATNILAKRNKLTIPKEGNFYYW